MDNWGYGQQTPFTSNSEYSAAVFLVRQLMARISTMKPVRVEAVHIDSPGAAGPAGTVDVLPLVNQIDGNGYAVPHGTVYGLPYFRLASGNNAVIMDPEVGDIGFVVCSDRDMSAVKSSRARANPGSRRQFALSDGVYIGGILNLTPTQYVTFSSTGIKLADVSGNVLETSAAGIVVTLAPGGDFVVNGISIVTHIHGGVTVGSGVTLPPTPV